nr:putative reverse transcriptase domain, zinc finger, CCHC-type, aspartic peptidase domain protein [Tanacetum cinerariifolium]
MHYSWRVASNAGPPRSCVTGSFPLPAVFRTADVGWLGAVCSGLLMAAATDLRTRAPAITARLARRRGRTKPNVWDEESVDIIPFGREKPRCVNHLYQPHRNDHVVDHHDRYHDDPIRSLGLKIETPEFTVKNMTVEEVINEFGKLRMRCDVVEEEEQVVAWLLGVLKPMITDICSRLGNYAHDYTNLKTLAFVPDDAGPIYDTDVEPELDEPVDELVYPDRGEATNCTSKGKICDMIIDGGSYENVVSTYMVEKLGMKTENHPELYQLTWLKKGNTVKVSKRCLVQFSIGKSYKEEVCCEVIPMDTAHILLGRPWKFSRKTKHDGFQNTYSFKKDGVNITLVPFDSRQTQAKDSNLFMKKTGFEGLMKNSPYVELAYVIPDDIPPGLPAMRDIQHCIDFILGFAIPNRPAYRMNPKEFTELQRQVTELLEKGLIRESMSPCAVPFLLVKCDASGVGIGGVLSQNQRPIAFFSDKLNDARCKYSTYDNEFYAIVRSLDNWRRYLLSNEIVLFFYHEALNLINGQHKLKPRHTKWVEFIHAFSFVIPHKVRSDNHVADALIPIILEGHAGGLVGHFGRDKTLALLREQFYWPKMEHDVNRILKRWRTCHITKTHSSNAGLYTPLSIPIALWLVNRTTGKSPFEVVYGRNQITPLDLVPYSMACQFSKEGTDQSEQIKELHWSVQEQIIRYNKQYKEHADKHRKQVLYPEGDLVWIHLCKDHFTVGRFGKLKPRGDGHFRVLKKINDNAYKIELPDSGSSSFQEGEDDADAVNERINVTNTLGAYFAATNFYG